MMKRSRNDEISAMANCLMLLSSSSAASDTDASRVFTCKTCNRQFPSFQALGGHRASHKKPKVAAAGDLLRPPSAPEKPKTHECSICGQEFPLGQALGGHMRRHRASMADQNHQGAAAALPVSLFPVVKKPSGRRVLSMDLNLTPLENQYFFIASSYI